MPFTKIRYTEQLSFKGKTVKMKLSQPWAFATGQKDRVQAEKKGVTLHAALEISCREAVLEGTEE